MNLGTSDARSRPPPSPRHVEEYADAAITVRHIQELVDTNNALRESVVAMAAMLKEQSNAASFNVGRRGSKDSGVDMSSDSRSRQNSLANNRNSNLFIGYNGVMESRLNREAQRLQYEESWREVLPVPSEAIEHERGQRRMEYEGTISPLPSNFGH